MQEQYKPDDEHVEVTGHKSQKKINPKDKKNYLPPAFPEKNLEEELLKRKRTDLNDIFDEFSVVPENPEIQSNSQSSIKLYDLSTHTKLISISPFRLIAGKKEDVYFELRPVSFKVGYGKFGERIVNCSLNSESKMTCPSPHLKPGEIKVSFSRDRRTWTNTVPAFVYRTNYAFQMILSISIYAFGIGGLILAFLVLTGRFQLNLSNKKPAALLNNPASFNVV
ncbi:hypothetical protein TVAG_454180 [Trichomonas vaginalis G3]|uniref:IPT/TIG domain-containing protein n=1 Tax=Trichomonas vaginalis (strain ATCC PRA-98 / G3) TaxID=412133 RepID=A2DPZ4_TRIV3|nr:immunoglobulins domain-containing protein [Trichomonas vaginalis G3]EAY17590.1 hypothetical protein TVAG_454180 [Trichomonas vaginalis G3]KAI5520634.1 immunoglobulins domain-containing protein [Trichomonas vaginalis G3]|eukprot:XP_001329725.1 hypothetical protein [Trichomonas vaginalis G3]